MGKKNKTPNPGIVKAIEIAGGQVQLAQIMQVKQPAIHDWLYRNVTPERAKEIEELLGVPRSEIRPDVFD